MLLTIHPQEPCQFDHNYSAVGDEREIEEEALLQTFARSIPEGRRHRLIRQVRGLPEDIGIVISLFFVQFEGYRRRRRAPLLLPRLPPPPSSRRRRRRRRRLRPRRRRLAPPGRSPPPDAVHARPSLLGRGQRRRRHLSNSSGQEEHEEGKLEGGGRLPRLSLQLPQERRRRRRQCGGGASKVRRGFSEYLLNYFKKNI